MPRFQEVLTTNPYHDPSEFAPEQEPANVDGSAISKSFWQERTTQERWYAKADSGFSEDLTRFSDDKPETEAFLESCANKIYAYYGITVARVAIVKLPYQYHGAWKEILRPEIATHLLSRWVDRFNCYGEQNLPPFNPQSPCFQLKIEEQRIGEQGLGHILAVAHFINDIDVIGGSGKNIGYKLISANGELRALSCKIDPGYAFHDFQQSAAPAMTRSLQFKTVGQNEAECRIAFESLPQQTKLEFIMTLRDIANTQIEELAAIFQYCRNPKIQPAITSIITNLQQRQKQLTALFIAELSTIPQVEDQLAATITRLSQENQGSLLQQMQVYNKFANQNSLYSQAKEFYIDLSVSKQPYDPEIPAAAYLLMQMVNDFSTNSQKIFGLLGDCGTGKSTFTKKLRETLWSNINTTRVIPIHIELQRFSQRTIGNCVKNALIDDYKLTISQINELKTNHNCLIILDGFDEIEGGLKANFWHSNELNSWRNVKLIITSRPEYLGPSDIDQYFSIQNPDPYNPQRQNPDPNSRIIYYLTPFSKEQITQYLSQSIPEYTAYWTTMLNLQPDLFNLLNTPLLLKIFRKSCPLLSTINSSRELTRFELYEVFMTDWFKSNEAKLAATLGKPGPHIRPIFEQFSQSLAFTMYEQGKVVISRRDKDAWSKFFDPCNEETTRARLGCPLRRSGDDYSFIHKSFYEYFLAKHVLLNFNTLPPGQGHAAMALLKEPEANNFFISLIKTTNPAPNITLGIFLELIGHGCQDVCETMLQLRPELAQMKGTLTDCGLIDYKRPELGNRVYQNITAFQYAVLALDYYMWTMLMKYLPAEAVRTQLLELEQVAIITNNGWIIKAGINWSSICWQSLIETLDNYVKNYEVWNAEQCDTYWGQQVGGAQLILPAHIINEYSHPSRPLSKLTIWNNSTDVNLPRTGISDWRTGEKGNKLGSSFAWIRGSGQRQSVGGTQRRALQALCTSNQDSYSKKQMNRDHAAMVVLLESRSQQAYILVSSNKASVHFNSSPRLNSPRLNSPRLKPTCRIQ